MVPDPGESIYFWMYRQGLRQRPLEDVTVDLMMNGHTIRPKDLRNYWNGWYRSELHASTVIDQPMSVLHRRGPMRYSDYPQHPFKGKPEYQDCFVPCSRDNRPLVKWSKGTMSLQDARAWPGCEYLAENMKGAQRIVIDIDGDHGGSLDIDVLGFFDRFRDVTCCHEKRDIVFDWYEQRGEEWCGGLHEAMLPTSYHLTFGVDRVIPTMHFPKAHVDIIGNRVNSLRYFKDKRYNGLPPLMMDDDIWDEITGYIEEREMLTYEHA